MARTHSHRGTQKPSLAIVGGESLLGKEVRDLLGEGDLAIEVKLIASEADEGSGIIAAGRDEPVVIHSLKMADLGSAQAVLLAGSAESSRAAQRQMEGVKPAPAVIDLSGALEELPASKLRAPMVEKAADEPAGGIQVIAHPAAIAIAKLLLHLRSAGTIRRAVIEVFEPVSERGQAGIDELQKQTVALLSFKPLPKEVFDTQVSFAMAPEYGSDSPHSLAGVEAKIDRHLASLLAGMGHVPMPSLRVIHAPVFHGYSVSAWVEFEESIDVPKILEALAVDNIDVRSGGQEPPSNVGVAGQGGITVGSIVADRNQPRAYWFWMAVDNLRIVAESAVEVVREVLE